MSINGKQSVKLEDLECNLSGVECYEGSCIKKYHDHVPCGFAYKVFVLMIGLLGQLLFIEAKCSLWIY